MAMAITRLDPFLRSHFGSSIDRLFEDVLGDFSYTVPARPRKRSVTTNVLETDTGHEISIVAPGIKKGDIEITLENNILSISYEKTAKDAHALSQNSFKYNWKAPKGVLGEDITAKYNAGILMVSVNRPAEEETKVETIQVK
tara:strand:+ start:178 stop:603 length:426 start_codon:yes stop_codon:yes gene_type:complete